ncbi:MAG: hypothetical protein M3N43_04895 [Actinomycetota bacterium]|nr:hypothetical protein [Actinomycetota bacterium]
MRIVFRILGVTVAEIAVSDDPPADNPDPEPDGRWEDAGEKADAVIEWAGSPMWRWPRRDR